MVTSMETVEKRCVELGIIPSTADVSWDDELYLGGACTEIYRGTVTYLDGSTSRLEVEIDRRNDSLCYIGKCR